MYGYAAEGERQRVEDLLEQMRFERESWMPVWRDLADFVQPMRGKWVVQDIHRGNRRNQRIYDNTATIAARTLDSGMMSGITNPARPWFRITVPDPDLAEREDVKHWAHIVQQRMFTVLGRSNAYTTLQQAYGDLGTFGTAAVMVERDDQSVVRFEAFPVGSYFLGTDATHRVNLFAREFSMTVAQLVQMFPNAEYSVQVQGLIREKKWRTSVEVAHLICPNAYHDPSSSRNTDMPYRSYYWEIGSGGQKEGPNRTQGFLRISGYKRFPVLGLRWETAAGECYGTNCPGMTSLGDIRELQLLTKRYAQAVEKMVSPPMQAPAAMRNQRMSFGANDVNFVPVAGQPIQPAQTVNVPLDHLNNRILGTQNRINTAYFADLFLMMAHDERAQRATATEIGIRQEEKLLALGPMLERLNDDGLNPLIDLVFDAMAENGLFPEPPEVLEGMDLQVEYVSIMAQAQRLVGVGGMERFANTTSNLAAAMPDILDVVNTDVWTQRYADMLGLDPDVANSPEEVAAIREARAQAQAEVQQAEAAKNQADAVAKLGSVRTDEPSLLNEMMSRSGGGTPNPLAL
jgi:hypothetical protein